MQTLLSKGLNNILQTLYSSGRYLHLREIARLSRLNVSTTSSHLNKLVKKNIVKVKKDANLKKFRLIDKETKISFDKKRFKSLNKNIYIPLKEFIKLMPKQISFIILFGSSSRKKEKKDSDIDLLIVLNHFKSKKLQKNYLSYITKEFRKSRETINSRSVYPLSLKFVDTEEFQKETDHLVKQAKETGFCIFGFDNFYSIKD